MIVGIGFGNALHDGNGLLHGRLCHRHRLEAAFQCRILLDVFAILGVGGGTNNLDVTPGQRRLEDVGGVHAALGISGTHQIVNLVHHQNDVAAFLNLGNQALHPAFKLTPKLCSCHQRRQIQQEHFLVPQLVGHITGNNPLRQALGNGSFAHARLAHQAGVVLLAAVQNLNHPLGLYISADDRV